MFASYSRSTSSNHIIIWWMYEISTWSMDILSRIFYFIYSIDCFLSCFRFNFENLSKRFSPSHSCSTYVRIISICANISFFLFIVKYSYMPCHDTNLSFVTLPIRAAFQRIIYILIYMKILNLEEFREYLIFECPPMQTNYTEREKKPTDQWNFMFDNGVCTWKEFDRFSLEMSFRLCNTLIFDWEKENNSLRVWNEVLMMRQNP